MIPLLARGIYFAVLALRRENVLGAHRILAARERWPIEQLTRCRRQGLIDLLTHAIETVPFYKELPPDLKRAIGRATVETDDVERLLARFPIVEKRAVQESPQGFRSRTVPDRAILLDKTSGSTGTPLVLPVERHAWGVRHARELQWMQWFGIRNGDRYATFWGLHWHRRTKLQVALRDRLLNRIRVSAYEQSAEFLEDGLRRIRAFRPSWFFGYPSALFDFCAYLKATNRHVRDLGLKAVLTTAEPLRSHQRTLITEVCGCRVATAYGGAEQGTVAMECPDGGLHQMMDTSWIEPRADQPREGEPTEILATDLTLRAAPLIRYAIGDEVQWRTGQCQCGRTYPLLERIEGRAGFPIRLPNGRTINANMPSYIFKPMAAAGRIRRYRFVDEGDGSLHLYLVTPGDFSAKEELDVRTETLLVFGHDVDLRIHRVEEIPSLPNAKHRDYVVAVTHR